MAPVVTPSVVLIFPWPRFQAVMDGLPLIGGKLYTYAPETSTPKASYLDPAFITANPNPVLLDDQGAAYVYLDGYYHLRLTDADDVLVWEVPSFTYSTGIDPAPGEIIVGSSDATVSATPGAAVISVPGLVPAGYRVKGITSTITEAFGTSGGLTSLLIGDATLVDRWGAPANLSLGTKTNQLEFHSSDQPIAAPAGYVVLISAVGGLLDSNGEMHVTAWYEALPADTP